MKFVFANIFLVCFVFNSFGQIDQNETIAYRNMKHVTQTMDTSVSFTTYDHHGYAKVNTIKIKLHLLAKKNIAAAEVVYADKEKYAFYYFETNKLIMIEHNDDNGYNVMKIFRNGIGSDGLYNWDGAFVKAVLDLIK